MRCWRLLLAAVVACAPLGPSVVSGDEVGVDAGAAGRDAGVADAGASDALSRLAQRYVGDGGVAVELLTGPATLAQLPAVVVGVSTPTGTRVVSASRPGAPVLTAATVLPLSSISKAITGLIAAREVVDGRFTATTPVAMLLKGDLASLVGERTVVELASHTAGYLTRPRDLDNATLPNEPASAYTRERLASCLARPPCSVGGSQRGQYLYSDLGSGLLGVALADARDAGYEALVQERLAGPLGLVDLHLRPASDLTRTVPGTSPLGEVVGPASMGILAGAGELLSTTDDMLRLLAVLLDPPAGWRPVVELAVSPATATGAIGWGIDRLRLEGRLVFSKSGEQAGYSSFVLWSPADGVGVVAFTTVGRSSQTLAGLALEVLRASGNP